MSTGLIDGYDALLVLFTSHKVEQYKILKQQSEYAAVKSSLSFYCAVCEGDRLYVADWTHQCALKCFIKF